MAEITLNALNLDSHTRQLLNETLEKENVTVNDWLSKLILKHFHQKNDSQTGYQKLKEMGFGTLEGKVTAVFHDDWSMTDEEFLQS